MTTVIARAVARSAVEALCLTLIAGAAATVYHLMSDRGFLRRPATVDSLRHLSAVANLPKVELDDVRSVVTRRDATLVDARGAGEFDAGHIDGAINVPPELPAADRRARLGTIAKDQTVIVYCSKPSCHTSDEVAAELLGDGFRDVRLFPGGWEAWSQAGPR